MSKKQTPASISDFDYSNVDAEALCHEMSKVKIESIADWMNTFKPYTEKDTCVCCGKYVPEGRQVCKECEENV